LLLALAAGAIAWYQLRRVDGAPRYRTVSIERGPLEVTVTASGTLNPVATVPVASPIAGQVKEIFADFNTPVKKGQVLARLDPSPYESRVDQARADVDAANSAVSAARVQLEAQLAEERRLTAAHRRLASARAQIRQSRRQLEEALAALKAREQRLQRAQSELDRSVIRAPVDGTVILRNVDAGQTVTAGPSAPVLFTIAQDLHEMQIEATVAAADAPRLKVGQHATFTVDALPRRSFSGEVRAIRKLPANAGKNAGDAVVIRAANPDLALLPGMSAEVRIVVERRENVLKVPNAALSFRLPGAARTRHAARAQVWVLDDREPREVELRLGVSDGRSTEVLGGPLEPGAQVVVGLVEPRDGRGPKKKSLREGGFSKSSSSY
jgi:HlyD family secretion protein